MKHHIGTFATIVMVLTMLTGCPGNASVSPQQQLAGFAEHLGVQYQVVDNLSQHACHDAGLTGDCFTSRITLTVPQTLPPQGWTIYFSHIAPIKAVTSDTIHIEHMNGDMHKLTVTGPLRAGDVLTADIHAPFWHASRSDVIPNWFVTVNGLAPEVISATKAIRNPVTGVNVAAHAGQWDTPKQYQRYEGDHLPQADAAWLYSHYKSMQGDAATTPRVIPQVESINAVGERVDVSAGIAVSLASSPALEALTDAGLILSKTGLPVTAETTLENAEQYQLRVTSQGITIDAGSAHALNYALLTLAQLYDGSTQSLPLVTISDKPAYSYRGMHIDIARNFPGARSLFNLVEQMFRFKLNTLHLHLADDEGWRLAIPALPELTEVGAYRCADFSELTCLLPQLGAGPDKTTSRNGYLDVETYQALLQYAQARNITVIPSFDMPGHSRAALKSMQARRAIKGNDDFIGALTEEADTTKYHSIQFYNDNTLNPCLPGTYQFLNVVLDELKRIHSEAGVPLTTFHMGADETGGAWVKSPACAAMLGKPLDESATHELLGMFVQKVQDIVADKGLTLAGWSDGLGTLPQAKRNADVLVTLWQMLAWGGQNNVYEWLNSDAKTVLAFPDVLYFDFPYRNDPNEPGYYWGSKNTDTFKVFQFTPQVLPVHQYIWTDRMGNAFTQPNELAPKALTGIQGQVWTEVIRSPETLDYMLYPRVFALAERAWHKPEWLDAATALVNGDDTLELLQTEQRNAYSGFARQLVNYALPQLVREHMNFRLPPPGVLVKDDTVTVNSPWPGLEIEYSTDNKTWHAVSQMQTRETQAFYRTKLPGTDHVSVSLSVAGTQAMPRS